jgi:hypothetical protein
MRTVLPLLLLAAPAMAAQGDLLFSDVRLSGGLTTSGGRSANLALMAGDLSYDPSVGCAGGLVLGLRLDAQRTGLRGEDGAGSPDCDLVGIQAVGGLGLDWSRRNSLEIVGGYAAGFGDVAGGIGSGAKDDRFHAWLLEATYLHTWRRGWQAGLAVGYTAIGFEFPRADGSPGTARGDPAYLRLVVGTRL